MATDNAEKSVKLMVENQRLLLTLIGFLIAGLFAFAGRSANTITWHYLAALVSFVLSAAGVVVAVSVSINQAKEGDYDPYDSWITLPYIASLALLLVGLGFGAFCIHASGKSSLAAPAPGMLVVDNGRVTVPVESKLKVNLSYDPQGNLQRVEISP